MTTQPADEATTDLSAAVRWAADHLELACDNNVPAPNIEERDAARGLIHATRHLAEALASYVRQQRAAALDEAAGAADHYLVDGGLRLGGPDLATTRAWLRARAEAERGAL